MDRSREIMSERIVALSDIKRRQGVTYGEQCIAMGITDNALRRYRRNWNEPSVYALRQMCRYYGVSADWLLGMR